MPVEPVADLVVIEPDVARALNPVVLADEQGQGHRAVQTVQGAIELLRLAQHQVILAHHEKRRRGDAVRLLERTVAPIPVGGAPVGVTHLGLAGFQPAGAGRRGERMPALQPQGRTDVSDDRREIHRPV